MGFWSDPFHIEKKTLEAKGFLEAARVEAATRPAFRASAIDNIEYAKYLAGDAFIRASNANVASELQALESQKTFAGATVVAVVVIGIIVLYA